MHVRILFAGLVILILGAAVLRYPHPPEPIRGVADTPRYAITDNAELPRESRPLYKVVRVVDGDTFVVNMDGTNSTVRLIGLDTPETVDPRKPVQCFGREASDKARTILTGKQVMLEFDSSQGTYDKYGRVLAYAFLPAQAGLPADDTNFNEIMIREGFAHEYTYSLPYTYQSEFKAAEAEARAHKRGLWHSDACAEESERAAPIPFVPTREYECSYNAYDCGAFSSQAESQYVLELCDASIDVHYLDGDYDGRACELLP